MTYVYVQYICTLKVSESEGDQCEVTITGGEKEKERASALVRPFLSIMIALLMLHSLGEGVCWRLW